MEISTSCSDSARVNGDIRMNIFKKIENVP